MQNTFSVTSTNKCVRFFPVSNSVRLNMQRKHYAFPTVAYNAPYSYSIYTLQIYYLPSSSVVQKIAELITPSPAPVNANTLIE